jgi:hypothetical protein
MPNPDKPEKNKKQISNNKKYPMTENTNSKQNIEFRFIVLSFL